MITTKDIARMCGVSVTTVNRALNGKPDVNPATRKLIVEFAEKNGYRPDLLARRLAKGRSQVVGILAFDLGNPFFAQFLTHFQRFARERGYSLHTAIIENDPREEYHALLELTSLRVDGIVYIPLNEGARYESFVENLGVPVVTLINRLSERFDFVGTNEAEVMGRMTTAALDRGYEHLIYVSPAAADGGRNHHSLNERRRGVTSVFDTDARVGRREIIEQRIDGSAVADAMRAWGGRTAIICFNDILALSAMKDLREYGFVPGRDYGLTGYDRLPILEYFQPRLTSIEYPTSEIAESAMSFLFDAVESGEARERQEVIIPSMIVFGDTL